MNEIKICTAGDSSLLIEFGQEISPEINAISTLLFVVVILLLAANNIREARAEKALAKRRY